MAASHILRCIWDPVFLVCVSSIALLKHLQSPPLWEKDWWRNKETYLPFSFISQQNSFYLSKKKLKSESPLQAHVIWSSHCEMCSDKHSWWLSRHNCIKYCFAVWLNTPCSRPVEGVLCCDVCCSDDNWFILTNCLRLSFPSYRDHLDSREKRYS